ncbi:MAG TPA: S-layer homology domain-containing protein [Clostridiales bacterium]|nr:S-layer homology domain-containing protein [Clostridiales bacterium]
MLLLFCLSGGAFAATAWDGTTDTAWYTANPDGHSFEIATPAELAGLASIVNAGTDTFAGKTVTLNDNLNLGGVQSDGVWDAENSKNWIPIGNSNQSAKQFAGTFNGNGKTVSNLYINATTQYQGLFGYIAAAGRIKNLSITSGCIKSTAGDVGGIAGYCYGYIMNCSNAASVTGSGNGGGIAGSFGGSGWLLNSFNTGNVKGTDVTNFAVRYFGGLVGNFSSSGGMQNCYNLGNVSDFNIYGAGITAQVGSNSRITNCYNAGTITAGATMYVANCIGKGSTSITKYTNVYGLKTDTINASLPAMQNPAKTALETTALKDSAALAATTLSLGSGFKAPSGGATYPQLIWENGGTYPTDEIDGLAIVSASAENGKVSLVMNELLSYTTLDKAQFTLTATINGGAAKPMTINSISQGSNALFTTVTVNFTAITADTVNQNVVMNISYFGGSAVAADAFDVAQSTEWPAYGVAPASGSGIAADPYLIANAENLAWFAREVNGGKATLCAKLTDDIDLSGKTWIPIGASTYTGLFDGNGYVIKNMTVNSGDAGLFGYIKDGGFVKNLGISSGTVTSSSNGGGISGRNAGIILNCFNNAAITSTSNGGGIVGACPGGKIVGCYNCGSVDAKTAGGIVGTINNASGTVMNVYNTGNVTSTASPAGGIAGSLNQGIIQNAYNTGNVIAIGAAPGGILGTYASGTVRNCYYLQTSVTSNEIDGTAVVSNADLKAMASTLGSSFVADDGNINSGYPVFPWQATGTYPADELEGLDIASVRAENGKVYVTLNKKLTYRTLTKSDFSLELRLANETYDTASITSISADHSGENSVITLSFDPYGQTTAIQTGFAKVAYQGNTAMEGEMTIAPSLEWKLYDAGSFAGGDGSQNNPYQIANEAQLVYLSNQVALGVSYEGKYFILTADLQLGEKYWYPIGSYGTTELTALPFAGHFDGQNHTLHNIYIPLIGTTGVRYSYSGVFGWNTGEISNLKVTGFIQGNDVGGIVAINGGTVKNCVNFANLQKYTTTSNIYAAGIVAQNTGDVLDCINYGNITATNPSTNINNIGGIVGTTSSGALKEATVSRCANFGTLIGSDHIGGIAADANSGKKVTISECFNAGRIIPIAYKLSSFGGIVGYSSEYAVISNCYNTGDISGMTTYLTNAGSGGITGGTGGDITNCYDVGSIGIVQSVGAHIMGSSIGGISSFNNCYFLKDGFYCGVRDRQGNDMDDTYDVKGMEAENMRGEDFVTQLNGAGGTAFVADTNGLNNGYPVLAWAVARENDAPVGLKGGENKITGLDAEKRYEYKDVNNISYTAVTAGSTEITGLDCGSYNVRLIESADSAPSDYAIVNVNGELKGTVTLFTAGNSYKGKYYAFMEGIPLNSEVSYQWFRYDSAAGKYTRISGATDRIYTPQAKDIGYCLYVEVYVKDCDGLISATGGNAVGKYTISTGGFTSVGCSTEANNNGKITGLNPDLPYEYKLSSDSDYIAVAVGATEINDLAPGVYNLRGKTTDLYTSSATNYTITDFTATVANAKDTAKEALDEALEEYTETDYSADNWTALNTAKTDGDTAIDTVATVAAINAAKQSALDAMAAVKTLTQEADIAAAKAVDDAIAALPATSALTLSDKDAVEAARTAYDALSETRQGLVTKLSTLEAAETKMEQLVADAADQAAAQTVIDQIAALPAVGTLTLADEDAVKAARSAYEALNETRQGLVINIATLEAAETKITQMTADQAAAQKVMDKIELLPAANALTLEDKDAVEAVRGAYDALNETRQGLVTNVATLEAAEAKITQLSTNAADRTAAKRVMDQIDALPAVDALTLGDKNAVEAARSAYEALSETRQGLVTNLATLEAAEAKIAQLSASATDRAAAQKVTDQIAALPTVDDLTLENRDAVEAARNAYEALNETRQGLVTNVAALEAVEAKITQLSATAADQTAAQTVIDQIDALPNVDALTLGDKDAVEAARSAYNALNETRQKLVTNVAVLEAAEAKMKTLTEDTPPVIDVDKMTDVKSTDWFYDSVRYVLAQGIMNGTSETAFDPNGNITRGQFVTILGRYAGISDSSAANPAETQFADVKTTAYYGAHVAWAAEKGITTGTTATTFAPNAKISRQDMALMMARFAKVMEINLPDGSGATAFGDDQDIAGYAKTAVYSMVEAKIIGGVGSNKFAPKDTATRAQAAKMMTLLVTYGK